MSFICMPGKAIQSRENLLYIRIEPVGNRKRDNELLLTLENNCLIIVKTFDL